MRQAEQRQRKSAWRWKRCARRAYRSSSSKRLRWTAAVKASWSTKEWASRTCVDCSRTKTTCQWIRSGPWSSTCPISSWVSLLSSICRLLIARLMTQQFFSDRQFLCATLIFNADILIFNRHLLVFKVLFLYKRCIIERNILEINKFYILYNIL